MDIFGVGLKENIFQPPGGTSLITAAGRSVVKAVGLRLVLAVMLDRTVKWSGTRMDSANVA